MYVVNIKNGENVIPIQNAKHKLFSGNVVQGINTIDSFQFSILPNNPAFNNLHEYMTLVEVINTSKNRTEFYGRVLLLSPSMSENGLITQDVVCESYFGFLCDSQQEYVVEKDWTVNELFTHIISCHNSQIEDYKKFKVVIDKDLKYKTVYEGIQRENTWETIKKKLLDKIGGEIVLSVENGINVITYCQKAGETKTTKIALSKNMKSIKKENNPSSFITRLIPLGAKLNDKTEERLEIDVATNKIHFNAYQVYEGKNYIDDIYSILAYGVRVGYVEFDDVTLASNLLDKGLIWLDENNKILTKYSITALDLSILGLDIDDFQIYNSHPIENKLLNIDDTVRIMKKNINVCDEVKSSFEIGDKFKTLSEIHREEKLIIHEMNAKIVYVEKKNDETVKNIVQQYKELSEKYENIPEGPPGPQGPQGEKGEKGEKGDPGETPTQEQIQALINQSLTNLQNKIDELEERVEELEGGGDSGGSGEGGGSEGDSPTYTLVDDEVEVNMLLQDNENYGEHITYNTSCTVKTNTDSSSSSFPIFIDATQDGSRPDNRLSKVTIVLDQPLANKLISDNCPGNAECLDEYTFVQYYAPDGATQPSFGTDFGYPSDRIGWVDGDGNFNEFTNYIANIVSMTIRVRVPENS